MGAPVFVGLDSLYVVVEYPKKDLFIRWSSLVDLDDVRLNEGVPKGDIVIKRGLLGYKLSVWDGDARLLLTDRVDDELLNTSIAGQGMGVMLQLGPKWLRRWGDAGMRNLILNVYGQLVLFGMATPDVYSIRLTRLDMTIDVEGVSVADFSADDWKANWVGYAKKVNAHSTARSREWEGFSVGTSRGAVRFKVYDKVAESEKRGTQRFWRSVWGIAEDAPLSVARFEWSVKAYEARFGGTRYLSELTDEKLCELLNYVSLKWGRLCVRQDDDSNQSRWPLDPLWSGLRQVIESWNGASDGVARRDYDLRPDLSPQFVNSAGGWLASLMARVGIEQEKGEAGDLGDALICLENAGLTIPELRKRAGKKWSTYAMLAGVS